MTRIRATVVTAITTAFLSAFLVPAAAWATDSGIVEELQRRRPRFGGFGFGAALCCLLVVAGIIAVVVLISRRRR